MIDLELFRKRYSVDKATYKQLKKEFSISFATINTYRLKLCLPKREKSFSRFEFDEARFKELYESREPFYNYAEMAIIFKCSEALICKIKKRMNLPDREIPSKLNVDIEKFKQMYLNDADYTLDDICEECHICISTLQKLKAKLSLPNRKNKTSYNEADFISAYSKGLSNNQLSAMFSMERKTVLKHIRELGLPPRKSIYEDEFKQAHSEGLSISQLSEKFKISRSQVYVYIRKYVYHTRVSRKLLL